MGGHGAAAARKGWREIDDPETKGEVRSLFLKRGIQGGTYDPRRGGMGWSDFFSVRFVRKLTEISEILYGSFCFFFLQLQARLITANEKCLGKKGFKNK